MRKKHWIFDWSGTLVDDMSLVVCATNYVLRQYGKPEIDRDRFRKDFRLPYEEFYNDYLPGVELEEIEAHFRKGFDASEKTVPILPYARELLDALKADGCKLYILSSMCDKAFSEHVVELGMDHYFEATYAGVLDKREAIGEIMQTHGMGQGNTVFVGDMTHDVETAHHAGIMSIGVLTGYNHAVELASSEPDLMMKDLGLLEGLLFGHLQNDSTRSSEIVKIRELEVTTFIGVPDEERADQQMLKVDVDMTPVVRFRELGDEIDGGVDYYQVSLRIKSLAMEHSRKLIETLAEDIATMVLKDFDVSEVRVEIYKYILPDTKSVGVELKRSEE